MYQSNMCIPPSFENIIIATLSPKPLLVRALTATLYGTSISTRIDVGGVYISMINHEM